MGAVSVYFGSTLIELSATEALGFCRHPHMHDAGPHPRGDCTERGDRCFSRYSEVGQSSSVAADRSAPTSCIQPSVYQVGASLAFAALTYYRVDWKLWRH